MSKELAARIANVVRDAGGMVVGRTKLQKMVYLLVQAGFEDEIPYSYKHYGPYSDVVAGAARDAHLLGFLEERELEANWGGRYSVYTSLNAQVLGRENRKVQFAELIAAADAVELELAATALFLKREGVSEAWAETQRRKPEKSAGGRLDRAKLLYAKLSSVQLPKPLPPV